MGEYTEQARVWTDAEGHVLHRMQVNEDCTWDLNVESLSEAEPLIRLMNSRTLSSRATLRRAFSTCAGARKLRLMASRVSSATAHFANAPVEAQHQ